MNNLAVVEGNEEKLVEAGAVQHYVTLLTDTQQYNESIQREAAHGLFMMAFKCPQNILNQHACLDGLSLCLLVISCFKQHVNSAIMLVNSVHC